MERYTGTQGIDVVSVDPVPEWGGETGLEEPMWQLGLAAGPESYPERPDESDCIYYLRTGFCGYGNRCRYNHPRDRTRAIRALRASGVEYPERFGQPVCQYYMRTGMCKYGASCKYHHPKLEVGSSAPVMLNIYGYPLRPGEKECSYYVRTGQCKYVVTCKYNHPGPGPMAAPGAVPSPAVYPTVQSPLQSSPIGGVIPGNWTVGRPPMIPSSSYVPGNYGPVLLHPGVVPLPGWTPYPMMQGPVSPSTQQPTVGANPIYGIPQLSSSYTGPYLSISSSPMTEHAFPERPDQPKCQYYLRTGDCKFGPMCKYHHPPDWSHIGMPSHPGAPLCTQYAQNGVCRFGPSCKFDHPIRSLSYNTSSSSLTNMSVAPYPIGSTNATLAPSSSSSDLRTELLSSTKDAFSSGN